MNQQQFDRWRDFAVRMARECYGSSRRPSAAWILKHVENFIDLCASQTEEINDWDQGPVYVCDEMASYTTDHGFYRIERKILDSAEEQGVELSDSDLNALVDQWEIRWFGPVKCCVRAGLDVAASPSAGVLGFTVGDLRRMYPEGLPGWISGLDWDHPLEAAPAETGIWL